MTRFGSREFFVRKLQYFDFHKTSLKSHHIPYHSIRGISILPFIVFTKAKAVWHPTKRLCSILVVLKTVFNVSSTIENVKNDYGVGVLIHQIKHRIMSNRQFAKPTAFPRLLFTNGMAHGKLGQSTHGFQNRSTNLFAIIGSDKVLEIYEWMLRRSSLNSGVTVTFHFVIFQVPV